VPRAAQRLAADICLRCLVLQQRFRGVRAILHGKDVVISSLRKITTPPSRVRAAAKRQKYCAAKSDERHCAQDAPPPFIKHATPMRVRDSARRRVTAVAARASLMSRDALCLFY